jgi:Holliday junction resolvase RusA-like endonuclease
MSTVSFTVAGIPAPQGSKTRTKWGMREDNAATKPWREAVAWQATEAMQGREPFTGALVVELFFLFPRPKSHYGTGRNAEVLRPAAPMFMQTKPDVDKCVRACLDAMKGIVYRDDSQVAGVCASKAYGTPHAVVELWDAADEFVAGLDDLAGKTR